tara:strand:+ start:300 stop:1022 length:723 start_codon:yes stop_codon:yes gene_type:complete
MSQIILYVRSIIFFLILVLSTIIWAIFCVGFFFLPYKTLYWLISRWNVFIIFVADFICKIKWEIKGKENLPNEPFIILSKHQSAWETIFFCRIIENPVIFVLKKELLSLPFFGWCLKMMQMISIDRKQEINAMRQITINGKNSLKQGKVIVIFPEGSRVPFGEKGKYKTGGAILSIQTNTPIIPIALNSGKLWPKNSFLKNPGKITISIGKIIFPKDKTPKDLMNEVENWIEGEIKNLPS